MVSYFRYIFFISVLFLSACRKDETTFEPYSASLGEINYFMQGLLNGDRVTTISLTGGAVVPDTVLTTEGGVRVFLANTEFLVTDAQGVIVPLSSCQQIKIVITEVNDKTDWLVRGLPSVTDGGQVADHSGAVHLRIFCDGKEMKLADNRYIKVQIPAATLANDMSLSYLTPNADGSFTGWEAGESNSVFWAEWQGAEPGVTHSGYELLLKRTGWATATRILEASSYSNYCVSLPIQFDGANTQVYLSIDGKRTITAMKSVDVSNRFCLENTPVGYSVQIITVSKAGPTFWLGNVKTETASDATFKLTPVEKTAEQISDFLQGL